MPDRVLVAGATGGVGQLVVAKLLERGITVRVLTRSAEKAHQMFERQVDVAVGDIRDVESLPAAMQRVTHLICCTGTTAFPSSRWDFEIPQSANRFERLMTWGKLYIDKTYRNATAQNSPEQVDAIGVANLVAIAPRDLQRLVFVSSCGVTRKDRFPYSALNAFGVLDAKQKGEAAIVGSGLPYTIIRPGRLIDGPFTSYDLNTLLKATTAGKQGVVLSTGDTLTGQTSRIDVAEACVACLDDPVTQNKAFEIINQGKRPAELNWGQLFAQLG